MKKVLAGLILSSFLAVLAVLAAPSIIFAFDCPDNQVIRAACTCGASNQLIPGGGNYCDDGTVRAGTPSGGGGEEPPGEAPELVSSGAALISLIEKIGNWVFSFLVAIAAIFLIVAGFFWVTAGGNPENVNKARTMLINALIGVVIALLARGLIAVVRTVLGG